MKGNTRLLVSIALGVLVIAGFWWLRPFWHGLVYGAIYSVPEFTLFIGLAVASFIATGFCEKGSGTEHAVGLLAILFVVAALTAPIWGTASSKTHQAHETWDRTEMVETLPQTDPDNPRILPGSVAQNYAKNSLQLTRHHTASGDITFINGTPHWSFAIEPDGLVNTFIAQQEGASFVNMTTELKDVDVYDGTFQSGTGMQLTDNVKWGLTKEEYWRSYEDPFVVPHEGELYIAIPTVQHEHHLQFGWPPVYSEPDFKGVVLVDQEDNREWLTPEEAREHPVLDGQNFYPYELARFDVESVAYQHGFANVLFTHDEQLELAGVPGEGNDQPFTVKTEEGIKYILAAEPWGDAHGIYQIWVMDARSGELELLELDPESSLLGPDKASQFVRKDSPRLDWSRMNVSEPIPVLVGNATLVWQVKVVPRDSSGVAFNAFVNADTGNVTIAEDDTQVYAYLAGDETKPQQEGNDTAEEEDNQTRVCIHNPPEPLHEVCVPPNSTAVVQIIGPGGELVDFLPVPPERQVIVYQLREQ